ncbi:MAG: type 4a pilus biogenesis protein PilO [Planctomycetota bacterium]|jgi:Tfp pilus assembly protein PilO
MSEKHVTLITLGVLAIVIVLGGVGVWFFQFNWLSQEKAELETVKKQLADAQRKADELVDLRAEVDAFAKKLAADKRIPDLDKKEYDAFADEIEEMKRRSGIAIGEAAYLPQRQAMRRKGAAQQPKGIKKVDYEFTCASTFYPLLRFVNLVETQPRFVEVTDCTIASETRSTGEGPPSIIRTMKMKVTTYAFEVTPPRKKLAPKDDAPKDLPGEEVKSSTALPE